MAASPNLSSLLSSNRVNMRDLGNPGKGDSQESMRRYARKIWFADPIFCSLQNLADVLGVSKVIFAERTASDITQGQYLFRAPAHHLEGWLLSSQQKSTLRSINKNGGAAIIVNLYADDACEILSHEIGHHIVHALAGLKLQEQWAAPTNWGRRDSRFDAHCSEINDEFFAESFAFYLGGEPMHKIDLRPVLRRVRRKHPRAFKLLQTYRASAVGRN
jgi:hypothetical protein